MGMGRGREVWDCWKSMRSSECELPYRSVGRGRGREVWDCWKSMRSSECDPPYRSVGRGRGAGLSDRLVSGTKNIGVGSVMVWGCMMWEGVGYGWKIDGRMDGEVYMKIVDKELQESIKF